MFSIILTLVKDSNFEWYGKIEVIKVIAILCKKFILQGLVKGMHINGRVILSHVLSHVYVNSDFIICLNSKLLTSIISKKDLRTRK